MFDVVCNICNKSFSKKRIDPRCKSHICSRECLCEHRRRVGLSNAKSGIIPKPTQDSQRRAALSRTGKGSGWIEAGYKWVRDNGRSIPLHRLVVEQHIGRPLHSDEIVHHIDHNKLNNDISNLHLCTRTTHFKDGHPEFSDYLPKSIEKNCSDCGALFKTPASRAMQHKCRKCRKYYLRYQSKE